MNSSMSRTFLSTAHLRTWGQASCKYTHSSRLSHDSDKPHSFLVIMVLPDVEKRRSGEVDVAGIASTHRAWRESHGKILTPGRQSMRGFFVFRSRRIRPFQTWISLLAISTPVRWSGVVSAAAACGHEIRASSDFRRYNFEELAPKYLYQDILVNLCLVLISTHNHLLCPENLVKWRLLLLLLVKK